MTMYLYVPGYDQKLGKFKEVDGKWPLFQITRLTRDPHTSKFQITYPNSKKNYKTFHFGCFKKKKKRNQKQKEILVTSTR